MVSGEDFQREHEERELIIPTKKESTLWVSKDLQSLITITQTETKELKQT